jgi:hypothetical protein
MRDLAPSPSPLTKLRNNVLIQYITTPVHSFRGRAAHLFFTRICFAPFGMVSELQPGSYLPVEVLQ